MDQHMGPYVNMVGSEHPCASYFHLFSFFGWIFFPMAWGYIDPAISGAPLSTRGWWCTLKRTSIVSSLPWRKRRWENSGGGDIPLEFHFLGDDLPFTGDFRGGDTRVLTHRLWEGIFFGPSIAFCF